MSKRSGIWLLLAALVVVGGVALVYAERYAIFDWWRLRDYSAPSTIAQLASDTTMTPEARTLFYINHPLVENRNAFNQACPAGSEHTIVLGCYHPVQRGIFLFSVSEPQLAGVEQVTAAHEMLHAAYDRLSSKERDRVDGLLETYYQHDLHDPTILAEIAAYKKSEPHDVENEMHSVFGTEVANLPAPLEAYYKQYFTNRHSIAQYATAYRSAFTTREAQVTNYDAQLAAIKPRITADEAQLTQRLSGIDAMQAALNADKAAGNTADYNANVPAYNAAVDTYNSLAQTVRGLIARYNQIVTKRNAVALEENHLSQELNSSAAPITN